MGLFRRKSVPIVSPTQPSLAVSMNGQPTAAAPKHHGVDAPGAQPLPTTTGLPTETGGAFLLIVDDVFSITGRGTVVTGKVEQGSVRVGDTVQVSPDLGVSHARVTGIEKFRKRLEQAEAGDAVGILLPGVRPEHVKRGTQLTA